MTNPEASLGEVLRFVSSNWVSIAGSIAAFYFVIKISMRNAILEAIMQLRTTFVSLDLYEERNKSVEKRLDKLESKKGGKK